MNTEAVKDENGNFFPLNLIGFSGQDTTSAIPLNRVLLEGD